MCIETRFSFGRYRGASLLEVMENAHWYITWCLDNNTIKLSERANHLWETGELLPIPEVKFKKKTRISPRGKK